MNALRHPVFLLVLLFASLSVSGRAAHVVVMIGEDEYRTWETLPEFATKDLQPLGHRVTIIHADAKDKNRFPGLVEALRDADLLFVSVRRRTLPTEQLDAVRAFLAAGKPLVGIRTASHAFSLPAKTTLTDPKLAVWIEFDPQVLGGHYTGHFGKDPAAVTSAPNASSHPILKGVAVEKIVAHGGLYKNTPLEKTATPLLFGTIPSQAAEPVAWTHRYGPKQARVFYTSLGHWDDFKNPEFRRMLVNGVAWALAK